MHYTSHICVCIHMYIYIYILCVWLCWLLLLDGSLLQQVFPHMQLFVYYIYIYIHVCVLWVYMFFMDAVSVAFVCMQMI